MWRICLLLLCSTTLAEHDWDLLIFTQHWPSTACIQYIEESSTHTCVRPPVSNTWAIHGVWPTKIGTRGPGFCNDTPFDQSLISGFYSDMLKWWPNLEGGKTESSLWEHEWLKHGTCATSIPWLSSQEEYFQQGLLWFQKYNMTSILMKHDIVPSQNRGYLVQDIQKAIYSELQVNPSIRCIVEEHSKKSLLFELRICFDKNFNLINCDGTMGEYQHVETNCRLNETILYPPQEAFLPLEPLSPFESQRTKQQELWDLIDLFVFLDRLL